MSTLTIHDEHGPQARFTVRDGRAVPVDAGARDRIADLHVRRNGRDITPSDGERYLDAVEALYSRYSHAHATREDTPAPRYITVDEARDAGRVREAQYSHYDSADKAFHTIICRGCQKSGGFKEIRNTPDGLSHLRCECGVDDGHESCG